MEKAWRRPGVEKTISEINESDFRIRILGTVVSHDDENGICVIDDGTGRATAFFESSERLSSVEAGKLLRIIGKVRKNGNETPEIEIDVEIIQDMNKLDLGLLEQARDVLEKLR
jgi:RPA family protein